MIFINDILASDNPLSHVVQHRLFSFHIGPVEVNFTNHMLMVLVAAILMLMLFIFAAREKSMVPRGLRNFLEAICTFIRDEVAKPVLGQETDKYMPFLWTIFFFILFCNILGMIPTNSIIQIFSRNKLQHLGGAATANIWVTGALAVCAFIMIHVAGISQQGLWNYTKNFIPHVPILLIPVMYILELIGALVKPFALAIRLFANMLAGHVVLAALLGLAVAARNFPIASVTVIGCAAISLLELFLDFLQAYIFTYLTTMFIGTAVKPEH